jgi:kynureninase
MTTIAFRADERFARELDEADELRGFREEFLFPRRADGEPVVYLCGNSLGLQPKRTRAFLDAELQAWERLGVEAHFRGRRPWYDYHEHFREPGARLVGARPGEVVAMNSLTVNLHLMLTTFYRPTRDRYKILIDAPTFPSDLYAVQAQAKLHGYDPTAAIVEARPRPGEHLLRLDDVEATIESLGREIAVVLIAGVNFLTGQRFDLRRLAAAAHAQGCHFGTDLAHAAGNVPLRLHDDDVDFAVWCSYKYLNSGPGAVGGCFVHERHGNDLTLPRLAGWWGNDPTTRFQMHLQDQFIPRSGADGWQLSNPPILALAPVLASLEVFDEAGHDRLRIKSERLTGYLAFLLERLPQSNFELVTPTDPAERGCQLSLIIHDRPKELAELLEREGVVCDFRPPNVLRAAPVPLYNSFHDVWRFAEVLARER